MNIEICKHGHCAISLWFDLLEINLFHNRYFTVIMMFDIHFIYSLNRMKHWDTIKPWKRKPALLAPLTRRSAQRSWWYYWFVRRPSSVVRRPSSVNFCFKSLLLLQFLFKNSEFFTGETRHIVPPCNKAGISNFCLEFQKLQKFQISWKRYSSYSSYSKILIFLLEKLGI